MYLHIGNDFTLKKKDIIGIFDFDNATVEKTTNIFLKMAEEQGNLINIWDEFPKSFIVINDRSEIKVYVSDISSVSLLGRIKQHF